MGLIKAISGAVGGVLADQWKEFFYCDSLSEDTLVTKGSKRISGRSSNTKASDNIISNGSAIAVADGQCMIIVEQGKVVEFCAEAGEFRWDSSTEPSIFAGSFGTSILDTFKAIGRRFTYGGDTGKDQRVYYFNTKEIIGNKYGTPNPVPFRVIDNNIGLDIDISIRCHGEYSYKIVNPILFYTNVCGNVESAYKRDKIDSQLKTELLTALQPALASISEMGIRYSSLPAHTVEIGDALNTVLSEKWVKARGLAVASFGVSSVKASEEDEERIKTLQQSAVYRDPTMAAAALTGAQAEAMKTAAGNSAGAMTGFMGLGFAQGAGGVNAQDLYAMGQQKSQQTGNGWHCSCGTVNTGKFCSSCGKQKPEAKPADGSWKCECGEMNTGKFCSSCGKPKPSDSWKCSCGADNKGKFCTSCGKPKPADAKLYRCDKCGWEPADPEHPPKFCPECGDIFNDSDIK